ncbi:ComEC family competence protein [Phycisphaerae bacterium RAS1]|nr:ComEC family competence protein [Phycisphaerae bacterium RAS1]
MFAEAAPRPAPLVIPALGFILGIAISDALGGAHATTEWAVAGGSLALLIGLILPPLRSGIVAPTAMIFVLAISAGFARHEATLRIPRDHVSRLLQTEPLLTRVVARVDSPPIVLPAVRRNPFLAYDPPPRTRFTAALLCASPAEAPTPLSGTLRVGVEGEVRHLAVGDTVELTGRLYRTVGRRNPGDIDWARWQWLQGIDAGLAIESPAGVRRMSASAPPLAAAKSRLRSLARSLLFESEAAVEPGDAERLLDTMILGQRSAVTKPINDAFIRTGTIHFLSVSGFHVGVLALMTWWTVRRLLWRGARFAAAATALVLLLYCLIAEPNAATTRATIMGLLACAAIWLRRPLSTLNWLALSAFVILALSPRELLRPGFQLSFVQVFFLVTLVPAALAWLTRSADPELPPEDAHTWPAFFRRKAAAALLGLALVSVLLWLSALPLTVFHFGQFAPLSPIQTILLTPLIVVTTVLGFVSLALGALPLLGSLATGALATMTDLLLRAVGFLASVPGTLWTAAAPPAALLAANYLIAALVAALARTATVSLADAPPALVVRRRRAGRGCIAASLALVALWTGWLVTPVRPAPPAHPTAAVLSVGNGNATLLVTPDRRAFVIDVGTNTNSDAGATTLAGLRALGAAQFEGLLVSHADADHYCGAATLLAGMPAPLFDTSYFELAAGSQSAVASLLGQIARTPRRELRGGATLRLGETTLEVLWPPTGLGPNWADNDLSIVARWSAAGSALLAPGDIGVAAMSALLDDAAVRGRLRADVLLAPHHGAVVARTADFLEAVAPHTIIISSLTPRPRLVELVLRTLGDRCRVLNTHDVGAVLIQMSPSGAIAATPFE